MGTTGLSAIIFTSYFNSLANVSSGNITLECIGKSFATAMGGSFGGGLSARGGVDIQWGGGEGVSVVSPATPCSFEIFLAFPVSWDPEQLVLFQEQTVFVNKTPASIYLWHAKTLLRDIRKSQHIDYNCNRRGKWNGWWFIRTLQEPFLNLKKSKILWS